MTCSWAACIAPAVAVIDGWPSCLSREHHINDDETARPCAVCGEPYSSPAVQRKRCDDCRRARRRIPTAAQSTYDRQR